MQAALYVRRKRVQRKKNKKQLKFGDTERHVANQDIKPFPRYNPIQVSDAARRQGHRTGKSTCPAAYTRSKTMSLSVRA